MNSNNVLLWLSFSLMLVFCTLVFAGFGKESESMTKDDTT